MAGFESREESVTCFTRILCWGFTPTLPVKLSQKPRQLLAVLTPSCGDVIRISAAAAARGAGWAVDERREGTLVGYLLYPPELNSRHQTFSQAAAVITTTGESLLVGLGDKYKCGRLPALPPFELVRLF